MALAAFSKTELPKGFLPHKIISQPLKTPLKNSKKQCKGGRVVVVLYRIEHAAKN